MCPSGEGIGSDTRWRNWCASASTRSPARVPYEDQNDAATLREDPLLKLVCGSLPEGGGVYRHLRAENRRGGDGGDLRHHASLGPGFGRALGVVSLAPDGRPRPEDVARIRRKGHAVIRMQLDP